VLASVQVPRASSTGRAGVPAPATVGTASMHASLCHSRPAFACRFVKGLMVALDPLKPTVVTPKGQFVGADSESENGKHGLRLGDGEWWGSSATLARACR
jgi:hypothetical protein